MNFEKSYILILAIYIGTIFPMSIARSSGKEVKEQVKTNEPVICSQIYDSQYQAICEKAFKSVVRINGGQTQVDIRHQGSGVIINKNFNKENKRYEYIVLSNAHVINTTLNLYLNIVTSDNKIHKVSKSVLSSNIDKLDLGVIYFDSEINYEIAQVRDKSLNKITFGDEVSQEFLILGYPDCQSVNCIKPKFTIGKYGPKKFLLGTHDALKRGYSIPYDNTVQKGMSGSPVWNLRGEVIAINGKGKYASKSIIANNDDGYIFSNGDRPNQDIEIMMRYFSWGIPIELANSISSKLTLFEFQKDLETKSDNNYIEILKYIGIIIVVIVLMLLCKFCFQKYKTTTMISIAVLIGVYIIHMLMIINNNTQQLEKHIRKIDFNRGNRSESMF
jgi:Trypsin-like peptidase domain